MPDYKNIKYSLADGVCRITFNRPPLNVLNIEMMKEINQALEGLSGENGVKLIVFDAEGKAFSAGVDVSEHTGDKTEEMIKVFHGIFRNLVKLNRPTLSIVNGAALGGGCEIAIFSDFIIASENSKFGQPEIQVGVFPPIACLVLPETIPQKRAMELLLTGNIIPAKDAESIGLINKCVPADQLKAEADAFIAKITNLSAKVLEQTKFATLRKYNAGFLAALTEIEDYYLNTLMKTADAEEGLKAFLEKRKPNWKNK